jgi:mono/diheme cytochrome c family protein
MKETRKFWLALSFIITLFSIFAIKGANRIVPKNNEPQASGDVRTIFEGKCAKCHGKDGRAKTFRGKLTHARNFTEAQWQSDVTDERLFNSISNGRNQMPDFKKKLSEAQINSLIAYVRQFRK